MTPRRGDLLAVLSVVEQLAAVESIEQLAALLPSVASLVGGACVIYHHSVTLTGNFRQVNVGWAEGGFPLTGLRHLPRSPTNIRPLTSAFRKYQVKPPKYWSCPSW